MLKIIAVGKIKEPELAALITDYSQRLSHYAKIEIWEVAEKTAAKDPGYNLKQEAKAIRGQLKKEDHKILLDLQGHSLDSLALAAKLADWQNRSVELAFIIGGSYGVEPQLKQEADFLWKLSDLTFPHQLVRLLLLEQLYRGYKIINNQTYHK